MIGSLLMMAKLKSSKGTSLLETLIVMMILSLLSSLLLKPISSSAVTLLEFQSSYLHTQYLALKLHLKIELETNIETEFPVTFNADGNVNMGQTVFIKNKVLVIMLGTGRIHEKSILND